MSVADLEGEQPMTDNLNIRNVRPALSSVFVASVGDGSKVDAHEAQQLISSAEALNDEDKGGCCKVAGDRGTKNLKRLLKGNPDLFDANSKTMIEGWIKTGRTTIVDNGEADPVLPGKNILDFKAKKDTWHCHWFPQRATNAMGGDPINNMYAPGGCLEKLDRATGSKAQAHERATSYVSPGDEVNGWFGHCNNASEVAVLLKEPVRDVVYNGVTFTPHDIQGLLCKISDNLAERVDFKGNRYNGPSEDPNDPAPHVFLETLQEWAKDGKAFVMDTDRQVQVWNYPYDKAEVTESKSAPVGVEVGGLPSTGKNKFYHARLSGTGYEKQKHLYQFWINYGSDGKPASSGWIIGEDASISPDFLWRPHPKGDLSSRSSWTGVSASNPEVNAAIVYDIYRQSI